jgi:intein-encoded DNA endonuclease-like protein
MKAREQVNRNTRRRFYEVHSKERLITELQRLYNKGLSQHEIAKILNIPRGTLSRWMVEVGIHGRDPGKAGKVISQKYFYNENAFENVTDPNIAYVLGFLMGDGYVVDRGKSKRFLVTLALSDRQIIDDIAEYLGLQNQVKVRKASYKNEQDKISLIVNSTKMSNDLANYGIVPNKTGSEVFTTFNSNSLQWAFLRGFFDADGYIRRYQRNGYTKAKFTLTGNQTMLLDIKGFLIDQGLVVKGKAIYPKQGCVSFEISSAETIRQLGKFLYDIRTGELCLNRKAQVFHSLMI